MMSPRTLVVIACLLLARPACLSAAGDGKGWALSLYGGQASFNAFNEVLLCRTRMRSSYLWAAAVSREIGSWGENAAWEVEGQVVKHTGMQKHLEFNSLLVLRWHTFPWDEYLDTTVAIGSGPSYTTQTPRVEAMQHDRTSRLLNYLMVELTLAHPDQPRWSLLKRIHHRSGAAGAVNGVWGGSNFIASGIRYHF